MKTEYERDATCRYFVLRIRKSGLKKRISVEKVSKYACDHDFLTSDDNRCWDCGDKLRRHKNSCRNKAHGRHEPAEKKHDLVKVILFGPLFTQAERNWNRILKESLEKVSEGRLKITLPQEEARQFIRGKTIDFNGIVDNCFENAESHDVAVAILDGSDADSGTCAEMGYRKGRNASLITVGVRTDFREGESGGLNIMLHRGTKVRLCDVVIYFPSFNENTEELARNIWAVIAHLITRRANS